MGNIKTLIKWPGGKANEIKYIEHLIPDFNRYIEPFFGGGAMFFHLRPKSAVINDISVNLMDFYSLIKEQDPVFKMYLYAYCTLFKGATSICDQHYDDILNIYSQIKNKKTDDCISKNFMDIIEKITNKITQLQTTNIILDVNKFKEHIQFNVADKMKRTIKNEQKNPYSKEDLKENLITGFTSGTYMYFRDIYNDIMLKRIDEKKEFRAANFYFIREYCYGSMFRYNHNGEFNIPYGGMSYNRKDLQSKIDDIFSSDTVDTFFGTDIYCMDFEDLFSVITPVETDFIFLDPPYDTTFSNYEGRSFNSDDQRRLAKILKNIKAKFILIIKNTDFIYSLYKDYFNVLFFNKKYTYNVRSRNERDTEHLIITNLSMEK